MLDELLKVDWAWMFKFVTGGDAGLAGWCTAIGMLIIGFGIRAHNKVTAEANVNMIRMDKTMEELTDALIENSEVSKNATNIKEFSHSE